MKIINNISPNSFYGLGIPNDGFRLMGYVRLNRSSIDTYEDSVTQLNSAISGVVLRLT